jgi:uncharacterized protein
MSPNVQAQEPELEPTFLDTEPTPTSCTPSGTMVEAASRVRKKPRAEPVVGNERFFAVDVLRGFALLGILAMNIVGFGWPVPAYDDPFRGGGFTGLDRGIWFFNHMFFEMKMMTIFSMLFGAGLVLMDQRAEARGVKIRGVYFRRVFWLLVIGIIHAYLIWWGDILVLYAETGFFLYFFRNLAPRTLVILGISAMLLLAPIVLGFAAASDYIKAAAARAEAPAKPTSRRLGPVERVRILVTNTLITQARNALRSNPEEQAKDWDKEMAAYRGGYRGIVKYKAIGLLVEHTVYFVLGAGFFAASRMLIGMGLMKWGVFSAQRSPRFYVWMVALGYGLGLPLMIFDAIELIQHKFSTDYFMHGGLFYNVYGSIVVALGHVGLLMLIVKSGALSWLTTRLAEVGRMALSNYLTHSIVCTTLFYGYGFGLFGHVNRTGLAAIVVVIWVIQLLISPIWLKHFRYGPAEWLWRSLTYWRIQPIWQRAEERMAIAA